MEQRPLGRTGITVSRVCLGTMTFGQQNSEAESFRLLDAAVDAGVNFLDTAEMYPIPPAAATMGRTEEIIGRWLRSRGNRHGLTIATKIAGPGLDYIRPGQPAFAPSQIRAAIDASLRRLQTDVIDLYQLHWPERKTNTFGRRDYLHVEEDSWTPFADVLAHLAREIQAGRVRAIGLSNETPWGVMSCLGLAEEFGLPRIAAVQNPYSLLNRLFEIGLAEVAIREDCGLLAYSPLAFGTLSGKYLDGTRPAGARLTLFSHYQRYLRPQAIAATAAYVGVARRFALDPAQMALAFVCRQRFLTSVIIGATTLPQLVSDLAGCQMVLDDEVLLAIEAIHDANPNPAP